VSTPFVLFLLFLILIYCSRFVSLVLLYLFLFPCFLSLSCTPTSETNWNARRNHILQHGTDAAVTSCGTWLRRTDSNAVMTCLWAQRGIVLQYGIVQTLLWRGENCKHSQPLVLAVWNSTVWTTYVAIIYIYIYIYIYTHIWPPLWSSGQSSWLQIWRPGFDSQHYQKKK
jgi:hypothetical protein